MCPSQIRGAAVCPSSHASSRDPDHRRLRRGLYSAVNAGTFWGILFLRWPTRHFVVSLQCSQIILWQGSTKEMGRMCLSPFWAGVCFLGPKVAMLMPRFPPGISWKQSFSSWLFSLQTRGSPSCCTLEPRVRRLEGIDAQVTLGICWNTLPGGTQGCAFLSSSGGTAVRGGSHWCAVWIPPPGA